jgi:hypothetical protein
VPGLSISFHPAGMNEELEISLDNGGGHISLDADLPPWEHALTAIGLAAAVGNKAAVYMLLKKAAVPT